MRVLVIGATGLIGSAVCARLRVDGHDVIGAVRPGAGLLSPAFGEIDVAKATNPLDWNSLLEGVDAVVNCAGALQRGPTKSPKAVHSTGIAALFRACEVQDVRRVIHFSAIGVDRGAVSEFSASKVAGDEALMALDLDWVILRPSVVLGRAAFGASALMRGIAALPVLPVMPDSGPLQVVALDDVVDTVAFFLAPETPRQAVLELAGPERLSFETLVAGYRQWLGWKPAPRMELPQLMAKGMYWMGDIAGLFGWRPPVRTTARLELVRGAVGDPRAWQEMTGISPRTFADTLAAEPASVQERWFAKLYFVKPLVFLTFGLFWIVTGIVSLAPGWSIGMDLMRGAGAGSLSGPGVIAGALADIAIGLAILYRPTARWGLYAALALSGLYLFVGTMLAPELWRDPLGALMKILPFVALNLVALTILEER